jgi:hypothetical protein
MEEVILEFNEEQQMFHYNSVINNAPKDEENRLGWKTLIVADSEKEATVYADFLYTQFLKEGKRAKFDELEKTAMNLKRFLVQFCSI